MPNWCQNNLTVTGSKKDVFLFVKSANGHTSSYNSFRSSETWEVFDDIRVTSIASWDPEPGEVSKLSFHALCPVPKEIRRLGFDDNVAKKAAETAGVKYPGMGGWGWQTSNWGTKWEPQLISVDTENDKYAQYTFDTAWSPPIALIEFVSKRFPDLTFDLNYDEPGMRFSGEIRYKGGVCLHSCEGEYDE